MRQQIESVQVNNPALRVRISSSFARTLKGRVVLDVERRAKYLVFKLDEGDLLVHLGMSGTLRVCGRKEPPLKHDHVVIGLVGGRRLVYNDPRRFGLLVWTEDAQSHRLLAELGIEPLSRGFGGKALFNLLQRHHTCVKNAIMNPRLVAGVGNIYANEALYSSRISPLRPAASLDEEECSRLAQAIKKCLRSAIRAGGSTLKDFVDVDSNPGYFQLRHGVYGRSRQKCRACGRAIKRIVQTGRATFYCPRCQQ